MALIMKETIKAYKWFVYEKSDQRTKDWLLLGSPCYSLLISAVYMLFVLKVGPTLMKNRKPVQVNGLIQAYNALQVLISGYIALVGSWYHYGPGGPYNWFCDELDFTLNEPAIFTLKICYIIYLQKILDLMDTVFFMLRKNTRQITFLHVYHHCIMVPVMWIMVKYVPGGHALFLGVLNGSVHAIMYSYYFITNYNSEYRKVLWWKKYITIIQIVQFLLIIIHNLQMIAQPNCQFPKLIIIFFMPQNIFIMLMFLDFYKKTYMKKLKV